MSCDLSGDSRQIRRFRSYSAQQVGIIQMSTWLEMERPAMASTSFGTERYVGVVTVEGINYVLEVHASLFVEGIADIQDSIFV
ncbi:hypothetical protein Syun_014246 [Stephania yunnanensis]|uniref:Uncharacterized protein n=1 Tax=Stephania yunnanensis TaxID=152371 RepID=A0AAP0JIZ2_9MAGN